MDRPTETITVTDGPFRGRKAQVINRERWADEWILYTRIDAGTNLYVHADGREVWF